MAAPTPTVRVDPGGIHLEDGYRKLITFSLDPDFSAWEKDGKPPGYDHGEPINQTTMHNDALETFAPGALSIVTPSQYKAAYDPDIYNQMFVMIGVEQTITERFSDNSTIAYYGYIKSMEPDNLQRNVQPEMTIVVQPTNRDPDTHEEEWPVLTSVAGT